MVQGGPQRKQMRGGCKSERVIKRRERRGGKGVTWQEQMQGNAWKHGGVNVKNQPECPAYPMMES